MKKSVKETVREAILPTVTELGYRLWDVTYSKVGADYHLEITIPAIFYATSFIPALAGFATGLLLAFFEKPLVVVAALSSLMVFVTECIIRFI